MVLYAGHNEVYKMLHEVPPGVTVWNNAIEQLTTAEDLDTIRFILNSHKDMDLEGVNFGPILDCRSKTWRNMEQIVIQYLEQGGNGQDLVTTKEPIIHVVLKKGIAIGGRCIF